MSKLSNQWWLPSVRVEWDLMYSWRSLIRRSTIRYALLSFDKIQSPHQQKTLIKDALLCDKLPYSLKIQFSLKIELESVNCIKNKFFSPLLGLKLSDLSLPLTFKFLNFMLNLFDTIGKITHLLLPPGIHHFPFSSVSEADFNILPCIEIDNLLIKGPTNDLRWPTSLVSVKVDNIERPMAVKMDWCS